MAPDGQTLAPNVFDAEPIPQAARQAFFPAAIG